MKQVKSLITILAVSGNIIFVLWILYNGINEGFKATLLEKISYFGMIGLLIINSILILGEKQKQ